MPWTSTHASEIALEKIRLLDAALGEEPFSPGNRDGRRDYLSLSVRFAVRLTDALQALETSPAGAGERQFFVEWEWAILGADESPAPLTLRRLEPILPPFTKQTLADADGIPIEFVIVPSTQFWNGLDNSGQPAPDGLYPFRVDARTVRVDTPGRPASAGVTSPMEVDTLVLSRTSSGIALSWKPVTEDVFLEPLLAQAYRVYRGVSPDFVPDTLTQSNRIAETGELDVVDNQAEARPENFFYIVTAIDGAGNESGNQAMRKVIDSLPPLSGEARIDNTRPLIRVLDPGPGAVSHISAVNVFVAYSDLGSGLDLSGFAATLDGADLTPGFTLDPAYASTTLDLGDGVHCLEVTILDLAGNQGTAGVCFTVDTTRMFGFPPNIESLFVEWNAQQVVQCDFTEIVQRYLCSLGFAGATAEAAVFVGGTYTDVRFQARVTDRDSTPEQSDVLLVGASFIHPDSQSETTLVLFDDGSANMFSFRQVASVPENCTDDGPGTCVCGPKFYLLASNDDVPRDALFTRDIAFVDRSTRSVAFLLDCIMQQKREHTIVLAAGTTLEFQIDAVDRHGNLAIWPLRPTVNVGAASFSCTGDECGCCLLTSSNPALECKGKQGMPSTDFPAGICVNAL